jgi:hypothetical protein
MMRRAARIVAAVAALGGLFAFHANAQNAVKVEVLYEGKGQAAICNATSATVLESDFAQPMLLDSKPTTEVERLTIGSAANPVRQKMRIHPGWLGCSDEYVWSNFVTMSGHTLLFIFRWPFQAGTEPTSLGVAADVDVAGPGLVFVPSHPNETVQERRRRIPAATFLMLPEDSSFYPINAIRTGTSDSGLPLLLAIDSPPYSANLRIAIIEAGQDPVRLREPTLKIEGIAHHPQAAWLSTLDSRPLLKFGYPDPQQPLRSYIVGAAVCSEPRSIEASTVDCSLLGQIRLPLEISDPLTRSEMERVRKIMFAIPQGGKHAFLATTEAGRTCIRAQPLNGLEIASVAPECGLEVTGRVLQIAAESDREFLIVTRQDGTSPTLRLLRVSGL